MPDTARKASFRGALVLPLVIMVSCARQEPRPGPDPAARDPAAHDPTVNDPTAKGSDMNLYTLNATTLEGKEQSLSAYQGKVTLLVNVASYCGNTPQYGGLERLQKKYASRGFSVLGFPSNDFGKQEPGSAQEIREFCSSKYQVTFPLFEKVVTKGGPGQSPVYAALQKASGKLPTWNFGKYVIGRDGRVVEFFEPNTDPEDATVTRAIEKALSAGS